MGAFLGSASGLSMQQLRSQRFRRLSRDLYLLRTDPFDVRRRSQAALLALPDGVICLHTAAVLQKLPVDDDGLIHVARRKGAPRSERADVQVHRTPVAAEERLDLAGLPVTDGPRTYVDLAAHLDREALVALGDVVLRRYSPEQLRDAVERRPGRRGIRQARAALPLLDAGSDSPAETRARLRLHAAGFPSLRHGVQIRDRAGQWLATADLADERARVAVQHDGIVHLVGSPAQRRTDLQRDELTRQAGWEVVVATSLDDQRPELLVAKVAAAYERSAQRLGRAVLPSVLR